MPGATPGEREYDDIPGTVVFDSRRARRGRPLNRFLMSLNDPANREAFRADERAYVARFGLDDEQLEAVASRQWLRLLEVGGNVYYTYKLAACDGMSFQDLAAEQTGMSAEAYAEMMLGGGRSPDWPGGPPGPGSSVSPGPPGSPGSPGSPPPEAP